MTVATESIGVGEIEDMPTGLKSGSALLKPIEMIASAILVVIIGLLLMGVTSRYVLSLPIVWIDEAAAFCFLWLAMLGAVIAIDRNEHLRLTLFLHMLPEKLRGFFGALGPLLVTMFLIGMLWPAIEYVIEESYITSAALNIPMSWRVAALPVGIGLMALLALREAVRAAKVSEISMATAVIVAVGALLWLASPSLPSLGNINILIFLVGFVAFFLVIGVPIAFCFGLGALTFLTFTSSVPTMVMIGRIDEGMSSLILLSVPIFVLLGCILDATGMGRAIVEFLASLLGHVKAGMSYVLLGSLFLVSGISGSKVSDMATVAPALFPEMKRRGHKPKEMIALLATGAAKADTVPPTIVLIVLGAPSQVCLPPVLSSQWCSSSFSPSSRAGRHAAR
jgi:TRAP-type C4-dicarboxylate transport system permease small subunit